MMIFGAIKNKDTKVMMEISNDIFLNLNKDILCSI
jgi:flagellar biosynthesis regulator FlbT